MKRSHDPVHERQAMLAGMSPVLKNGTYFFCTTDDAAVAAEAATDCLATFHEDEGITLVLDEAGAIKYGFDQSIPMSRIVLKVFSALDGVGLTAGVATALAMEEIPCNMIAAYHHDNVFVPQHMRHQAVELLKAVQRTASKTAG